MGKSFCYVIQSRVSVEVPGTALTLILRSVNNPLTLLSQKSSCTLDATNPPKSPNKEKFLKRNAVQRPKETFVKRKTIIRRQVNLPHHVIKTKWTAPRETIALQNLMRRFPSALKQINKRLVSQNLLWYTLNNRRHQVVNH